MATCTLCQGTAGSLIDGTHALCAVRAKHGRPTPTLGMRCETCGGNGVKPGFRGGVFLDLDLGPALIRRSIAAQFPPCVDCKGKGYTGMNAADARCNERQEG